MKHNTLWKAVLCGALGPILWATSAAAVMDPTNMCAADKIKAAGKYSMCLLNEQSKAIKRGLVVDFSGCNERLTKNWTKAEGKGGLACPTVGDQIPLADQVGSDAARIIAGLSGQTAIGSGVIETDYDVLSLKHAEDQAGPGEAKIILVKALDRWGGPVAFTAEAEDGTEDCVTVSADTNAIAVTAFGKFCDERIKLTSETGVTKILEVKVYDPMVMDIGQNGQHLLIKYADKFRCRWSDLGTGGGVPLINFFHAAAEPGWFPLGSTIIRDRISDLQAPDAAPMEVVYGDPPRKELMILVKELPSDPNAADPGHPLMPPETYTRIWFDGGYGTYWGSVWRAECPSGYVALGVVARTGRDETTPDDMRCVKENYTIPAGIGGEVTWLPNYGGVFRIGPPPIPSMAGERAPLDIDAVIACNDYSGQTPPPCDLQDAALARLLLVPLEVVEKRDSQLAKVSLDANGAIDAGNVMYAAAMRLPFTLMPNLNCHKNPDLCAWNVGSSPFYRLRREESYVKIMELDNRASAEKATQTISYSTGFDETRTEAYKLEVGLEVTGGGEAKFLGSGGKWEVKVSTKFGWDWSTARSYSTGTNLEWQMTCPAFTYGVAAQVKTQFHAFSENDLGPIVSSPLEGGKNSLKWLQYPEVFP